MFICIINIQWLELKTSSLTPCGLQCTNWERLPDVLSNHKLVISIQLNGQLKAEPDNSMCFHYHIIIKVGRVPNNVHNGKLWSMWRWTHCNPVFDWQRTIMYVWLCALSGTFDSIHIITPQLHTYHMMPTFRKLTRKYTDTIISIFQKYSEMKSCVLILFSPLKQFVLYESVV